MNTYNSETIEESFNRQLEQIVTRGHQKKYLKIFDYIKKNNDVEEYKLLHIGNGTGKFRSLSNEYFTEINGPIIAVVGLYDFSIYYIMSKEVHHYYATFAFSNWYICQSKFLFATSYSLEVFKNGDYCFFFSGYSKESNNVAYLFNKLVERQLPIYETYNYNRPLIEKLKIKKGCDHYKFHIFDLLRETYLDSNK